MVKITETPVANSMASGDIFLIVTNPSGIAQTAHIQLSDLFANLQANVVVNGTHSVSFPTSYSSNLVISYSFTPATSSDTVEMGRVWFDTNYIYVAVANNVIKRAALETF